MSELENQIINSKDLNPGDHHYRAYVGPPDQYDFMGGSQFQLLFSLGLREEHRVVDFGCGSLRAGKILLQYLMPDRYTGIEPNQWLWQAALLNEIGSDVLKIKRPRFSAETDFSLGSVEEKTADFVVAQSIYSHAGLDMLQRGLAAKMRVLKPDGQFLFTIVTQESPGYASMRNGTSVKGWVYPQCVGYKDEIVDDVCKKIGFHVQKLDWYHPRQSWFRAVSDSERLLTEEMQQAMGTGRPLFDNRFA